MWISDDVIDATLLRLFHDRKAVGSGTLTLAGLQRAWRKTGLRATDLDVALRRLESQACLRSESNLRGDIVVLLPEGEQRLHGLSATVGELGRWISHALGARLPGKIPPCRNIQRRRRTDHEPVEGGPSRP